MSINTGNGIKANEKPTSDNMSYVYAENAKKEFVRIQKEVLKMILGIPTKLSELNNDKGFVDKMVNDLENYYLKSETYTRDEIDNKLSLVPRFSVKVVSTLPTEGISETTVYLVPSGEDEYSLYTEYINVDGLWEILGTQKYAFSGNASDVIYDDSETNLGADNVQGAIGKLSETVNDMKQNGTGTTVTGGSVKTILGNIMTIIRSADVLYKTDISELANTTDELIANLGITDGGGEEEPDTPIEPDEPTVTLSSISATYTGGEVATGTPLSDLTGITVTATYSDGSTKNVTGYTLSGEILEGENTITVSYGGKTTTFKVTGFVESGGDVGLPTDGLYGFFDLRNPQKIVADWHTAVEPLQGSGVGTTYLTTTKNDSSFDEYGSVAGQLWLCDANVYGKEADSKDLGTEFSICVKHYGGVAKIGDHINLSTLDYQYCALRPKYNTSSGTGFVPQDIIDGTHGATEYHNVNIVVNGEIFKFYLDGKLIKTYKGSDYDDFTSWYSKNVITTWYDAGKVTAVAIYTKELNEVEIVELDEYFKTLEVA